MKKKQKRTKALRKLESSIIYVVDQKENILNSAIKKPLLIHKEDLFLEATAYID